MEFSFSWSKGWLFRVHKKTKSLTYKTGAYAVCEGTKGLHYQSIIWQQHKNFESSLQSQVAVFSYIAGGIISGQCFCYSKMAKSQKLSFRERVTNSINKLMMHMFVEQPLVLPGVLVSLDPHQYSGNIIGPVLRKLPILNWQCNILPAKTTILCNAAYMVWQGWSANF